jgi:quinoprotein glucose dehydrogenase
MCKLVIVPALLFLAGCTADRNNGYDRWETYAGSKEGNRYSSIHQINPDNVGELEVAWQYSTGDKDSADRSQIQCNPIIVDGIMYGTSARLKLFAVEASTGRQKWLFDPSAEDTASTEDPLAYMKVNRGVTYWEDETGTGKRIFYSAGSRTYAIDALTGKPVRDFGKGGYFELGEDLDYDSESKPAVAGTTPGIIYKDLLIIGMRLSEGSDAAPGHIRAFDVRTGKRRWIFHTIPHPGERGYDTWEDPMAWKSTGGANNWAGMALDEKRGIVYVPTGSATPDFYGGFRKGQNLFANSLVALDAATGKYKWHFQVIHHDLWDRDLSANPNLVTVKKNGKKVDAVAQITKHGYIFMFDRVTGEPIHRIDEMPVDTSGLPGEKVWPTQPVPVLPEPFARQRFGPEDVTRLSADVHKEMMEKYRKVKFRQKFAPPSKEGGWIFPGFDGGGEWGGAAVDPESNILYINSTELPWVQVMVDVPETNLHDLSLKSLGGAIYNRNCLSCHGPNLEGNGGNMPSLARIYQRYSPEQTRRIIQNGGSRMPAFKQIRNGEMEALLTFLHKLPEKEALSKPVKLSGAAGPSGMRPGRTPKPRHVPYTMAGYTRFTDKAGYPGIQPPWGTLNAVDLNLGKLLWKVPLGEYEELTKKGIPVTGTENYGGPLVTSGGLVFIAATRDEKIRAFDKKAGKVLWEAKLPAAGYATPATYMADGRQFLVIACGGGKIGSKSGDSYVAFALPETLVK